MVRDDHRVRDRSGEEPAVLEGALGFEPGLHHNARDGARIGVERSGSRLAVDQTRGYIKLPVGRQDLGEAERSASGKHRDQR